MQSNEIRTRFLKFFEARGHAVIPSASLVPEHDPSVLFTTAGMHPLIPYLLGEPHPAGDKLVNVQKCVRTQDIEEVGDNTHDTFFEMLGNWSLGSYFKKDAIKWSYEFLTSKKEGLGLDPARLYITVFGGNDDAPKDQESFDTWRSVGIPENHIYWMDGELAIKNWWSPGDNGPCGPDSEMFYDVKGGLNLTSREEFLAADERQDIVEIWNDVFMEYLKKDGKVVGKLSQQNVDTGAGLERLAMVMQGVNNIFATDLFETIMPVASRLSNNQKSQRIIADHIRTSVFMIADGVIPSNTDQGYVLRKIVRRAISETNNGKLDTGDISVLVNSVTDKYGSIYRNTGEQIGIIKQVIQEEAEKFEKTKERGDEMVKKELAKVSGPLTGHTVFGISSTLGVRQDDILNEATELRMWVSPTVKEEYKNAFQEHQALSRKGGEQKFKGGLLDHSPQSVKYHTATHLLHQALRTVLGTHVFQKGSNITPERLRFDFSFERKMTDDEKKRVEDIVNEQIGKALPVTYEDLPISEAEKKGAIGLFEEKYGDKVRVYKIGDFSLEFCGGPHVTNTSELGTFKITKEEAVSQGVRRIKAALS